MKVLFLHPNQQDYLADGLFHGLRSLLGKDCVDVPRYDCMYNTIASAEKLALRGHGFTLYGLLDELPELQDVRENWKSRLASFDLIVVSNIFRHWRAAREVMALAGPEKVVLVDGEDSPVGFPYRKKCRKTPEVFLMPVRKCRYFKRELIDAATFYNLNWMGGLVSRSWMPTRVFPLAFSIPAEKVAAVEEAAKSKCKTFPTHIVDGEVAARLQNAVFNALGAQKMAFTSEDDYKRDILEARFGITAKRAGWDCLRHYELAALGAVLCFRDFSEKPAACAPHGLSSSNCVIYRSADELFARIESMPSREYESLSAATRQWIEQNTTRARASQFLAACGA